MKPGTRLSAEQYMTSHWMPHETWRHLEWDRHRARFDSIAAHLPQDRASYADIGCALGHSTAMLKARVPGDWTGVDFSQSGIAAARKHHPDLPFVYCPDYPALRGLSFDVVACSEVIEHVQDDAAFIDAVCAGASRFALFTTPTTQVSDPGHLRLYDLPMLHAAFEPHAPEIERAGPFWIITVTKSEEPI